jgi:hypothetical protein
VREGVEDGEDGDEAEVDLITALALLKRNGGMIQGTSERIWEE